jgi:hypothetical protein
VGTSPSRLLDRPKFLPCNTPKTVRSPDYQSTANKGFYRAWFHSLDYVAIAGIPARSDIPDGSSLTAAHLFFYTAARFLVSFNLLINRSLELRHRVNLLFFSLISLRWQKRT